MNSLLYISLLPTLILGFYIYKNDQVEKEPISLLLRCFIGGILAGAIVLFSSLVIDYNLTTDVYNILIYSFIIVGLIEEGTKFILTYLICYKNREFNYMYDGICYASFLSLGFATLENILYIYNSNSIIIALARSIATVPAHIFFGIFMGYYLGVSKYYRSVNDKKNEKISIIKSLLLPVVLHGVFDFCLYTESILSTIIFIVFLLYLYIESFNRLKMMGKIRTSLYEK